MLGLSPYDSALGHALRASAPEPEITPAKTPDPVPEWKAGLRLVMDAGGGS